MADVFMETMSSVGETSRSSDESSARSPTPPSSHSSKSSSLADEEDENSRKKRCHDRYDSSESSDSGVVVTCTDCGSSQSDLTEPCSPLSTDSGASSERSSRSSSRNGGGGGGEDNMPPTAGGGGGGQGGGGGGTGGGGAQWTLWAPSDAKRAKFQGKITNYFKTKSKPCSEMKTTGSGGGGGAGSTPTSVHHLISELLTSSQDIQMDLEEEEEEEEEEREDVGYLPSTTLAPPTPPATSPESDTSSQRCEESGDVSLPFPSSGADSSSGLSPCTGDEEGETLGGGSVVLGGEAGGQQEGPTASSVLPTEKRLAEEEPPRTIRFPVKTGWSGHFASDVLCKWAECGAKFATSTALIEHLQVHHVNAQTQVHENFVCRWTDCKVFGRSSCSRTWLERHVLSHGGGKPYRCIVEGCGLRFSSQNILQRHVNGHFTANKDNGNSKKSCDSSNKLIRRNGKKLRIRSHPFSADRGKTRDAGYGHISRRMTKGTQELTRIYDFFDAGIMEGLQHNLIEVTERRTLGLFDEAPGDTVTVQSKVVARRVAENGQVQILLRWFPSDILDDEWVDPSKVDRIRHVPIRSLPSRSKDTLNSYLFGHLRTRKSSGRKSRPHLPASGSHPDYLITAMTPT